METVEDLTREASQAYNMKFMVIMLIVTIAILFGLLVWKSIKATRTRSMVAPKLPYILVFLIGILLLVGAVFWTLCGQGGV